MGRWVNRAGLSKVRIGGGRRRHISSTPSVEVVQEVKKELTKVELFLVTMKYIITHDNKVSYHQAQLKVITSTKKTENEALVYLQELLNRGFISKELIDNVNHISITKKACDKIREMRR